MQHDLRKRFKFGAAIPKDTTLPMFPEDWDEVCVWAYACACVLEEVCVCCVASPMCFVEGVVGCVC